MPRLHWRVFLYNKFSFLHKRSRVAWGLIPERPTQHVSLYGYCSRGRVMLNRRICLDSCTRAAGTTAPAHSRLIGQFDSAAGFLLVVRCL